MSCTKVAIMVRSTYLLSFVPPLFCICHSCCISAVYCSDYGPFYFYYCCYPFPFSSYLHHTDISTCGGKCKGVSYWGITSGYLIWICTLTQWYRGAVGQLCLTTYPLAAWWLDHIPENIMLFSIYKAYWLISPTYDKSTSTYLSASTAE
jgi:hypothetical protein